MSKEITLNKWFKLSESSALFDVKQDRSMTFEIVIRRGNTDLDVYKKTTDNPVHLFYLKSKIVHWRRIA